MAGIVRRNSEIRNEAAMQQCGECGDIYDESESAGCPSCDDDDGDDYTHVIVSDRDTGEAKVVPRDEAHLYR